MARRTFQRLQGSMVLLLTIVTLPHVAAAPFSSSCNGCGTRQQEAMPTSKRNTLTSLSSLTSHASISSSVSYSSSSTLLSATALSPPPSVSGTGNEVADVRTNDQVDDVADTNVDDLVNDLVDKARIREEQVRLVRDEILKKLDMVTPPTAEEIARANISEERMQEMYRLYYQSVQQANSAAGNPIDGQHLPVYRDEIYSFRSTDGPPSNISFLDWFSPRKLRIFLPVKFPQESVRVVHNATLHLFITPPGIIGDEDTAIVRIYQLLAPPRTGIRTPRRFVTSKEVSLTESSWVTFPINEAASMWVSDPTTNHGLEVECDLVLTTHLFVSGYSNGRVSAHRTHRTNLKPRVDITLREGTEAPRQLRRTRRQSGVSNGETKCDKYQQSGDCCRRRNLTISFRELNLNFILAPLEYNAYFCEGECTELYNLVDTHALLRALIRSNYPNSLPKPCCVPSKLGSLPVLYLHKDADSNKTEPEPRLHALPDMVVESCGCS
uniref:GDF2 n=1 Tax=Paracentrotus lividus TaxID=7656 RepID=A0A075LYL7_PARLI|nr:GDF2 [Paracentrotus lividus]